MTFSRIRFVCFSSLIFFVTSLVGCTTEDVSYRTNNSRDHIQVVQSSNDLAFSSTNIYDAKSMVVGERHFTILLNNDALYSIDDTGAIVNKLSHTLSEYEQVKTNNPWTSIHVEVIEDIDQKGMPDLLIILKEGLMKDTNSVMAISYETGSIIWEHQPILKTKDCNVEGDACTLPIRITHYEVRDNLYLSAGYAIQEINYKTGQLIREVSSDNNIWDFEFTKDLTGDGVDEIVLATQPNRLSVLDGRSYNTIKNIHIDANIEISSYITIEQNIWDIEYISSRDQLIAAGESGIIYEVSLGEGRVIKDYQIFDTNKRSFKEQYMDLVQQEYSLYEQDIQDRIVTISFGRKAGFYKNVEINEVFSIDEDIHNDYIVSYDPVLYGSGHQKSDTNNSYTIISSSSGIQETKEKDSFYNASLNYIYAYKSDEYPTQLLLQNVKTQQNLANLITDKLSRKGDQLISKLFFLEGHRFIILTKELNIISLIDHTEQGQGLEQEFSFYSNRVRQKSAVMDDYLVIKDYDLKADVSKVGIYDEAFNSVYEYKPEFPYHLIDLTIENDLLYLMEYNKIESKYYVSIINLETKKLIKRIDEYKEQSFIRLYFYDDVTGDGILELAVRNFNYIDTVLHHSVEVFDVMKDETIFHYKKSHKKPERGFHTGSSIDLVEDLNDDGKRDLIFRVERPSDGLQESLLFVTSNTTKLFEEARVIPNDTFINQCIEDYNENGSKDSIVSDSKGFPSIYDYLTRDQTLLHYKSNAQTTIVKDCTFDFNQDHTPDLVTVDIGSLTPVSNEELSDYKVDLDLKINTLKNNELDTVFNHSFTYIDDYHTLNALYSSSLKGQFAAFMFNERENQYTIAMFKYDEHHNIILEEYNLNGNKHQTKVSNPYTRIQDDGEFRYGKQFTTVKFKDTVYYHATITDAGISKHYFINTIDYTIDYVIYGDEIITYSNHVVMTNVVERLNNPLLVNDEFTSVLITKPFSATDIEVEKTGILANQFNVNINRDDIVRIRHYYEKDAFNEYYEQTLNFVLPPGKHIIKLEITTESGDVFYFNEVINVRSNNLYIFGTMFLLVILCFVMYYIVLYIIKKYYFRK